MSGYNINYKLNDYVIYNYCLTSDEKTSYIDSDYQGQNNTQNIIYKNNLIRIDNTKYRYGNIARLNNIDNTPQRQDIIFPNRQTDIFRI